MNLLPKIVIGLIVFLAFWILSLIAKKIFHRIGKKANLSKNILILIKRTTSGILIITGAITALGTMGINVSALVAGLGLTGFAVGFALKDFLSNLIAGVLILIYKPFQCNDHISVSGFEGIVTDIDLRYTTISTDSKTVLIPNSTLFTNSISILKEKTKTK